MKTDTVTSRDCQFSKFHMSLGSSIGSVWLLLLFLDTVKLSICNCHWHLDSGCCSLDLCQCESLCNNLYKGSIILGSYTGICLLSIQLDIGKRKNRLLSHLGSTWHCMNLANVENRNNEEFHDQPTLTASFHRVTELPSAAYSVHKTPRPCTAVWVSAVVGVKRHIACDTKYSVTSPWAACVSAISLTYCTMKWLPSISVAREVYMKLCFTTL